MFRHIILLFLAFMVAVATVFAAGAHNTPLPAIESLAQHSIVCSHQACLNTDAESPVLANNSSQCHQEHIWPKKKDILHSYSIYFPAATFREQKIVPEEMRAAPFLTYLRALLYPKHWFG